MKECNRWNAKRARVCNDGEGGLCDRCVDVLDACPELLDGAVVMLELLDEFSGPEAKKWEGEFADKCREAIARAKGSKLKEREKKP